MISPISIFSLTLLYNLSLGGTEETDDIHHRVRHLMERHKMNLKFVANWQDSFIYLNSEKNLLKPGNTIKIQWPLN